MKYQDYRQKKNRNNNNQISYSKFKSHFQYSILKGGNIMRIKAICIMLSLLFLPACGQKIDKMAGESLVVELSRPFTFVESCNMQDPLLQEILREDMKDKKTPLELIHYYAEILNKGKSHGKIGKKLDTLFLCGRPPGDMDGYYHGITIGLKTGLDIYTVVEDARRKLGIGAVSYTHLTLPTILRV